MRKLLLSTCLAASMLCSAAVPCALAADVQTQPVSQTTLDSDQKPSEFSFHDTVDSHTGYYTSDKRTAEANNGKIIQVCYENDTSVKAYVELRRKEKDSSGLGDDVLTFTVDAGKKVSEEYSDDTADSGIYYVRVFPASGTAVKGYVALTQTTESNEQIEFLPFTDVPSKAWYQPFVRYVYENEMFSGTSKTTFSPDNSISRGQLVTVLGSLEHKLQNQYVGNQNNTFPDVADDKYYAKYVGWAQDKGFISGYPDGKFHPDDNITREQLAVIMDKYIQMRGNVLDAAGSVKAFSDAKDIAGWAAQAVENMQKYDLMTGRNQNKFAPKETLTRAETAVVITRLYEAICYPAESDMNYQAVRCELDTQNQRILPNGLAPQYGENEHIRYQCISDYNSYIEIVNRAKQYADSFPQDFKLLDESFFQEHNIIAVELNHYGSPLYQTKLSDSYEVWTPDNAADFWLNAEFFSSNAGGATADSVSYIFFIEASKQITRVHHINETYRVEAVDLTPY